MEIENLIKAQCIGLHRVCNRITENSLKEWRRQFGIRDINHKWDHQMKKNKAPGRTCITIQKENKHHLKFCQGITCCNKPLPGFNARASSIRSEIKLSISQCNRCSRHATAIRKGIQCMMELVEELDGTASKNTLLDLYMRNFTSSVSMRTLANTIKQINERKDSRRIRRC